MHRANRGQAQRGGARRSQCGRGRTARRSLVAWGVFRYPDRQLRTRPPRSAPGDSHDRAATTRPSADLQCYLAQPARLAPARPATPAPPPAPARATMRPPLLALLLLPLLLRLAPAHPVLPATPLTLRPPSPRALLRALLHAPRAPAQSLSATHLHLSVALPPLPPASHIRAHATLTQPSRTLLLHVTPVCPGPCPPPFAARARLRAPVDADVRVALSTAPGRAHLAFTLLVPALRAAVDRCRDDPSCLEALLAARCADRPRPALAGWARHVRRGACKGTCVVAMLRACAGELRPVGGGLTFVTALFLKAASVGVVAFFVLGVSWALLALPLEFFGTAWQMGARAWKQRLRARAAVADEFERPEDGE